MSQIPEKPPILTVLFDFDGTLADHFNALYNSYAYTLEQLGHPIPDFDTVKRAVGGTMMHTMELLIGKTDLDQASKIFRAHFTETMLDDITPLPGSNTILRELHRQGFQLGVHTNKHGPSTRRLCEHLNWSDMMGVIQGSEDTPFRKPEAACTEVILRQLEARSETCIMIGDSPFDVATARNAGMRVYTVATGTHSLDELAAEKPDGNFPNLVVLARELFGMEPEGEWDPAP